MANPQYKDASGSNRYRKTAGNAGSLGDPDIFVNNIEGIEAGASPDIGSTTDAAVITDSDGSIIAFLRGIVKLLATIFPTSRGQKAKTGSLSVALASDDDLLALLDGSHKLGGVAMGDSFYAQAITPTSSANMTALADVTPAPSSGEHRVIESVTVSAATAMIVTLKEETTNTVVKVFNLTAGNLNAEWNPARGLRLPNVDKKLRAISDTVGQVDITVISHSAS